MSFAHKILKVYSEVTCSNSLSLVSYRGSTVPCNIPMNIYRGAWRSSQYCKMLSETQPWNPEAGRDLSSHPYSMHDFHSIVIHLSLIAVSQSVSEYPAPVSVSPAELFEMQNPEPCTRHTESEYLRVGPKDLHFQQVLQVGVSQTVHHKKSTQ